MTVTIAGVPLVAEVKEFSTGSLGWYLNGKTTIEIDGTPVPVQIGLNLTIVGSKELPRRHGRRDRAEPAGRRRVGTPSRTTRGPPWKSSNTAAGRTTCA